MSQAAGADGGKVSSLPSSAERVDANTGAQAPRATALGLDPPRPTRVVEITITGSPIGQDHCHQTRRRLAGLRAVHPGRGCLPRDPAGTAQCLLPLAGGARHPSFEAPQPQEVALSTQVIEVLAKVLLCLNLPDAEQLLVPERSDQERRLRQLGSASVCQRTWKRSVARAVWLDGKGSAPGTGAAFLAGKALRMALARRSFPSDDFGYPWLCC